MAIKTPKISEFRDRIKLLSVSWEIDAELNRREILTPVKEVWACITPKTSRFDDTSTGTRPEIHYSVILRKLKNVDFGYIEYKGKVCALLAPIYDVDNKYTFFEMVEIDGKEHITSEAS